MAGDGQRLAVAVVLLESVRTWRLWAAVLPQILVLLANPVQVALQLLDAPALGIQELGLALDDVVELQEVLHCPVWALWAGLHGGSPVSGGKTTLGNHHSFRPRGAEIHPPHQP